MMLVADSGSTKTAWRLIDGSNTHAFSTSGINPYFLDTASIVDLLQTELLSQPAMQATIAVPLHIYFYGAGCANKLKCEEVQLALQQVFSKAIVQVNSDLLGAARALCGEKAGMAAILGTGSNSCLYDGVNITNNRPSLGFILGDEGSGAYLGKLLIQALLNGSLPIDLINNFHSKYALSQQLIIEAIYRKPFPNRFLASFTPFLAENKAHQWVHQLILAAFEDFFKQHISQYPQYQQYSLHCTGSIAAVFEDILQQVAQQYDVKIGNVIANPIDQLVSFHLKQL